MEIKRQKVNGLAHLKNQNTARSMVMVASVLSGCFEFEGISIATFMKNMEVEVDFVEVSMIMKRKVRHCNCQFLESS
jgi:hypoxanthine-guanine phosphoribosyltransferase